MQGRGRSSTGPGTLQEQLRRLLPGCAGKTRYETKRDALDECDLILQRNEAKQQPEEGLGLNVYRCLFCHKFHVGRDRKKL